MGTVCMLLILAIGPDVKPVPRRLGCDGLSSNKWTELPQEILESNIIAFAGFRYNVGKTVKSSWRNCFGLLSLVMKLFAKSRGCRYKHFGFFLKIEVPEPVTPLGNLRKNTLGGGRRRCMGAKITLQAAPAVATRFVLFDLSKKGIRVKLMNSDPSNHRDLPANESKKRNYAKKPIVLHDVTCPNDLTLKALCERHKNARYNPLGGYLQNISKMYLCQDLVGQVFDDLAPGLWTPLLGCKPKKQRAKKLDFIHDNYLTKVDFFKMKGLLTTK